MICNFDDYATSDRQALIASVPAIEWQAKAVALADQLLDCREACLMAVNWLDQGASGRAREELLRVLHIK